MFDPTSAINGTPNPDYQAAATTQPAAAPAQTGGGFFGTLGSILGLGAQAANVYGDFQTAEERSRLQIAQAEAVQKQRQVLFIVVIALVAVVIAFVIIKRAKG
jgi:hypothetical protein